MSYIMMTLQQLLNYFDEEYVQKMLKQFKSIPTIDGKPNDVECFLHEKAIHFEKTALATTHLIFSTDRILLGFFALANKPLTMTKKNYENLSSKQKRMLRQSGYRTESGDYQVNSYLIGQLGKNYSLSASQSSVQLTGVDLLTLAYDTVVEATKFVNARYIWIECERNDRLIQFYKKFGFIEIENYQSVNGLKVFVLKIHQSHH